MADNADATATKTVKKSSQPGGQTAEGSGELGGSGDFEEPITRLTNLGTATKTEVDANGKKEKKTPAVVSAVAKALGLKRSNVLGYNERTRVIVTDNGGKYQLSKNGKALRHLAGPKPPKDLELDVVDARVASPFTGTAAALNASIHESAPGDEEVLRARKAELEGELAAVNAELGEDDSEEEE